MESKIAKSIKMKYTPVALLWADEKPEGAVEFQEGRWGCVMALVASASKGKVSAAKRETVGCGGGGIGLGFVDSFDHTPGGIEYFLSTGNPAFCETEEGKKIAEVNPDVLKGERYIKTPGTGPQVRRIHPRQDHPDQVRCLQALGPGRRG